MSNVQTPKHVPERGCYRRRTSVEDCIAALTIYDRVEYVSATVTQGVFTHVCSWTEFNKEFEPSKLDYAKTHAMLVRRAERSGATDRAQELLKSQDPARKPPEGEVEMATKKAATKEAPAEKPAKATKAKVEKVEVAAKRGRPGAYSDDAKIKLLVKENPKRAGSASAARFDLYKDNKTVGALMAAGGSIADIHWDIAKGYIEVA